MRIPNIFQPFLGHMDDELGLIEKKHSVIH